MKKMEELKESANKELALNALKLQISIYQDIAETEDTPKYKQDALDAMFASMSPKDIELYDLLMDLYIDA